MTLDEIRELKRKIKEDLEFGQADLADLEEEEKRIRKAPPKVPAELDELQTYVQRMTGLLDEVVIGSDFRISFCKAGEDKRTNLLPPSKDDQVLRRLARSMLLERIARRVERAGGVLLVEVVDEE